MKVSLTLLAAAATLATAGLAQAAEYQIDPNHTNVTWEQVHFGTSTNRGRWAKKSGTVQFDRAAKTGKVELTLDMDSVDTGVAPFNKHLKGDDFFAADKFPTATFVSDEFVFDGDKVSEVKGKLTLRGQTHPVTLKATRFNCFEHPSLKREICGGDFEATIKRSLWGVNWGLTMGVPDDTKLTIQAEAIKQ
ncbi:MAG: YceI family protein [Burkholderiaceae bacterium]